MLSPVTTAWVHGSLWCRDSILHTPTSWTLLTFLTDREMFSRMRSLTLRGSITAPCSRLSADSLLLLKLTPATKLTLTLFPNQENTDHFGFDRYLDTRTVTAPLMPDHRCTRNMSGESWEDPVSPDLWLASSRQTEQVLHSINLFSFFWSSDTVVSSCVSIRTADVSVLRCPLSCVSQEFRLFLSAPQIGGWITRATSGWRHHSWASNVLKFFFTQKHPSYITNKTRSVPWTCMPKCFCMVVIKFITFKRWK